MPMCAVGRNPSPVLEHQPSGEGEKKKKTLHLPVSSLGKKVYLDLLFFPTNPITSLPILMKAFAIYGYISNLKINYAKSEALNVSLPDRLLGQVKMASPFRWESRALKNTSEYGLHPN